MKRRGDVGRGGGVVGCFGYLVENLCGETTQRFGSLIVFWGDLVGFEDKLV